MLPVGLLVGFIAIFILLFGDRLIPAVNVKTLPVVTLRSSIDHQENSTEPSQAQSGSTKGELLFQASGWVEPDPYITYVPALVNGVVDKVHVLEGQSIKKGDLLATLIDDNARLDLAESKQNIESLKASIIAHCQGIDIAKAELEAAQKRIITAKSRLNDAQDNLDRLTLIDKSAEGAVPKQRIVQASSTVQQHRAMFAEAQSAAPRIQARITQIDQERIAMESRMAQLEIARDRAQLALDRTHITSPIDAIILHLHAAPGKKRMLDMDDPKSAVIVELYEPEKLQARIDVPLNEAAALSIGQSVELLSDLLPDTVFHGKVTRIAGQADLQRNTLQVKVTITNPDARLRPDMLVRSKFFAVKNTAYKNASTNKSRLSIYVPKSALVSETQVWVISSENTAVLREIKLGNETRDDHRLVISGLKSGEHVILPPHDQLKHGLRVKSLNEKSN